MNEKMLISVPLLNTVVQYLASRPYAEVVEMIKAIQQEAAQQPQKPQESVEIPPKDPTE